jgi:hypothetical protein
MKHFNVPALDGIPGIMPGTITVPPPPEFEEEEIESTLPQDRKDLHPRNLNNIPRHKRRMMPCDKVEKKNK